MNSARETLLPNLATFYDEMTGLVNEGSVVATVQLDLRNAFRTVCQNSCTEKLRSTGWLSSQEGGLKTG